MGMGPIGARVRGVHDQLLAQQQQDWQQQLAAAAQQPIPGMTGPTTPSGGRIPGVLGYGPSGRPPGSGGSGWRLDPTNLIGRGVTQWMHDNMSSSDWASLLPPGQQNGPGGPIAPAVMQPNGPYGQQAMVLAGLLGNQPTPQIPTSGYQGLLGRRSIPGAK